MDEQYVLILQVVIGDILPHSIECLACIGGVQRYAVLLKYRHNSILNIRISDPIPITRIIIHEYGLILNLLLGIGNTVLIQIIIYALQHNIPSSRIITGNAYPYYLSGITLTYLSAYKTCLCCSRSGSKEYKIKVYSLFLLIRKDLIITLYIALRPYIPVPAACYEIRLISLRSKL